MSLTTRLSSVLYGTRRPIHSLYSSRSARIDPEVKRSRSHGKTAVTVTVAKKSTNPVASDYVVVIQYASVLPAAFFAGVGLHVDVF